MSSSEYHFFGPDGGPPLKTVTRRNGYGSHPIIWAYLCKKYLNSDSWLFVVEQLWKTPETPKRMTPDDRFLLRVTYDGFLVRREDFVRLAAILRQVFGGKDDGRVNHWLIQETSRDDDDSGFPSGGRSICQILEENVNNAAILGMGVYATSVSEDVWQIRPEVDDDGNETGDYGWVDARTARVATDTMPE